MPKLKNTLARHGFKWHRLLAWTGVIALFIFAGSALLHPLMVWTGPRAVSFFPPQTALATNAFEKVQSIARTHQLQEVLVAKIVPGEQGPLFQVTENHYKPRTYYDLQTGEKLDHHDQKQAVWLARYYTGLKTEKVIDIKLQTEFSAAYPWVNRLLPVYRVSFDTPDNRIAYIYTELGALAGHTNDWKTSLQALFGLLHTANWLDKAEPVRLGMMLILLVSLTIVSISGIILVLTVKKRKILEKKRKFHNILSYGIWLPLLALLGSGIYHLIYSSTAENNHGIALGEPFSLAQLANAQTPVFSESVATVNEMSFVPSGSQDLLMRVSIPAGGEGQAISDVKRFSGTPHEKKAFYIDIQTGKRSGFTDRELSEELARTHFSIASETTLTSRKVTHFGMGYDFRNKRLPVWEVTLPPDIGGVAFMDPVTGALVDRNSAADAAEIFSFSMFHKWNFLMPLTGMLVRDLIVVLTLLTILVTGITGLLMLVKKNRARKTAKTI